MIGNVENRKRMEGWGITSPEAEGFHKCIVPGVQDCKAVHIYRLNLNAGSAYTLESGAGDEPGFGQRKGKGFL